MPLQPDWLAAVPVQVNTHAGIELVDVGRAADVPLCAWTPSREESVTNVRRTLVNIVQY